MKSYREFILEVKETDEHLWLDIKKSMSAQKIPVDTQAKIRNAVRAKSNKDLILWKDTLGALRRFVDQPKKTLLIGAELNKKSRN